MIELLLLGKRKGWRQLRQAVDEALQLGTTDAEAVRHLMVARELTRSGARLSELGELQRYERPLPNMEQYDQFLGVAEGLTEVAP
jgi:hypothetical protein